MGITHSHYMMRQFAGKHLKHTQTLVSILQHTFGHNEGNTSKYDIG